MAEHNRLGEWGEKVATEYLVAKGYAILDTNARIGHYELDIVAMLGDRLVFVEVKTRSEASCDPLDAIDKAKIRNLCRAADAYVRAMKLPHDVQFDVITIIGTPMTPSGELVIEHFPDAFLPPFAGGR